MITPLTPTEQAAWDAYVRQAPGGLPLHLAGWQKVLRQAHGCDTPFLLARDGERVCGVLPLFIVHSRLLGTRATTMPGGLCASDPATAAALIEQGLALAQQAGARRLHLHDSRQAWPGPLATSSDHVHWRLDLTPGADTLWHGLDGNIRRQVRIARRHKLRVAIDRQGDLLDPFYDLFSRFTHQAGTPVFGRDFLAHVIAAFPGGFNIAVVFQEERPLAGYFQLEMGQTVYGLWGASLHDYRELRPAYLAIWSIIANAAERGFTELDMGRSPAGSTASQFKGQWGGVAHPVYQQSASAPASAARPDRANGSIVSQVRTGGQFRLFTQIWPRLPHALTRYLGPRLRHHIPFA